MSIYKKPLLRLIALFIMAGGTVWLSRPSLAQTQCQTCRNTCESDYQQCLSEGLLGCDTVLRDCLRACVPLCG